MANGSNPEWWHGLRQTAPAITNQDPSMRTPHFHNRAHLLHESSRQLEHIEHALDRLVWEIADRQELIHAQSEQEGSEETRPDPDFLLTMKSGLQDMLRTVRSRQASFENVVAALSPGCKSQLPIRPSFKSHAAVLLQCLAAGAILKIETTELELDDEDHYAATAAIAQLRSLGWRIESFSSQHPGWYFLADEDVASWWLAFDRPILRLAETTTSPANAGTVIGIGDD